MFSPRRWMGFLFGQNDAMLVERLASEIALRCHPEVYDRIARRKHGVDRSMLKGYVRAHAAALIAEEVEAAADCGAVARLRRELTAAIRAKLVSQVVEDLLHAAAAPSRLAAAA